jgi:predicted nucleotidyltransferase
MKKIIENTDNISYKFKIFDKKNKSHSDIDIIVPLNKEEYSMKKFISLDTKLCLLLCGLYLEVPKKILVRKRVIY